MIKLNANLMIETQISLSMFGKILELNRTKSMLLVCFVWLLSLSIPSLAQQQPTPIVVANDSVAQPAAKTQKTNPVNQKAKRAALLSAILPGLGQTYNKKYWKIPLIYGGAGAIGYYIQWNNGYYSRFRNAIILRLDGDPSTIDEYEKSYPNADQLRTGREYYRRNRDLLVIVGVFVYLLNIADATIDAHLSEFDISDNISLRIRPNITPLLPAHQTGPFLGSGNYQAGLQFTFSLK